MNIKILFTVFCFFSFSALAVEKPYIISGFDDVLRQAENTSLINAGLKILEPDTGFSGMSTLYTQISANEPESKFSMVSAISVWFKGRINKFLKAEGFPTRKMYLRRWLTQWSIEGFKLEKIAEIISKYPNRKFIVIFDNSDASLDLANSIKEKFSDSVLAIYLHSIVDKNIPSHAKGYFTAFDIAYNEYSEERLELHELQAVAEEILNVSDRHQLFPEYAICPIKNDNCNSDDKESIELCERVATHIRKLCL